MAAPALQLEPQQTVIAPQPTENRVDALGRRTAQADATRVVQMHVAGLEARRRRDLISQKLLLHIDGSGDFQWADIYQDQRVVIPRSVSEYRKSENLLRLVVENAVAHHTTMPLKLFASSAPDRRSRERAIMDTLFINQLAEQQNFNGLASDGLFMAMPAGFCPLHRYWRDDAFDQHEPVGVGRGGGPAPGMIDCWVGNPFDTVFNPGALKDSVTRCSYGRVLNADLVRAAFAHVPGADKLQGSRRIPSAAVFQRIARSWTDPGLNVHGSPVISSRRWVEGEEELLTLICAETAPGVDSQYPMGRLQIVAVPGEADLLRGIGNTGHAFMLADQALPAGDFSWTLFYSHHRGDDVHGKPWVEDIDQLQVDLNIAKSKRWEQIDKMSRAPIVAPGGAVSDDMADIEGYNLLEVEPSAASWMPRVMQWPTEILAALDREVNEIRSAIYTAGGYQAASRGEAPGSRIAYRAIVALQQADNSIHGPVNMRYRRSMTNFAKGCWRQFKQYGDIGWALRIAQDEYAYLAQSYIDNTKVSDTVPNYKMVNAFGPSPELRAQEVIELMGLRGADGQVFLTTEEARRQYPNPMIFDQAANPKTVQRRRAKTVAETFHTLARQFRERTGFQGTDYADPQVQQAAMQLFMLMETQYPRLRDDDLQAHLDALSEITQDETSDPIARLAAQQRQNLYFQWQQMMAQTSGLPGPNAGAGAGGQAGRPEIDRRAIRAQVMSGGAREGPAGEDTTSPALTARG